MHFFINRPVFATVISVAIVIVGRDLLLRVARCAVPRNCIAATVVVRASYAGATAETLAQTVATPLEQEINGVEDMLYMESSSTADGTMQLTITFANGTDLDDAQVLVQNRVALAEPRLPQEVRQIGVTTQKSSPDILDGRASVLARQLSRLALYQQLCAAQHQRRSVRQDGVGNVQIFGVREYNMRIWIDPDRLSTLGMTTSDIVDALAFAKRASCRRFDRHTAVGWRQVPFS